MTTADWDGDECFMCNGTGRDRWPITERRGIFGHVVGHVENGRRCRACNGHGRLPSMSEGETWSGENPTAATVSDARTGVASGKIGPKQDGSQPRCVNTSTGSLTADSTPALPGGISG